MSIVTLGICSFTHDSAAAMIVDGQLVGLFEEDRLRNEKHTKAFPDHAVARLLATHALRPEDVHAVGYNYAALELMKALVRAVPRTVGLPADRRRARARSWALLPLHHHRHLAALRHAFPRARITGVAHHRCHALAAVFSAGYEEAAVLSIDSIGEGRTSTIAHWRDHRLHDLWSAWDTNSLGYVYGAITEHLGFRRGDEEGTVMAMAAFGDRGRFRQLARSAIVVGPEGFTVDRRHFPPRHFGPGPPRAGGPIAEAVPPRGVNAVVKAAHIDLAAAFQERTEEAVVHLARLAREMTGSTRLVLTGGVALNCLANARILEEAGFDSVYVPPSPGDGGTPVGAAIHAWEKLTGTRPSVPVQDAMLGPSFSDNEVDHALWQASQRPTAAVEPAREIAARIADGEIVGVFHGRAEAGPRALGHRSILASPFVPGVTSRLSAVVKEREPFRPFAPVVRQRDLARYFERPAPSPFMSFALRASPELRAVAPAVVHVDGSCRVQSVHEDHLLHAVLDRFEAAGFAPVIINTSLNQKGRPTSGTPATALSCFVAAQLDSILIGDRWVQR